MGSRRRGNDGESFEVLCNHHCKRRHDSIQCLLTFGITLLRRNTRILNHLRKSRAILDHEGLEIRA